MKNILRWIAVPFMFPAGLLLGYWVGLLNGVLSMGLVGMVFFKFMCGAFTSIGAVALPAMVAPSHKLTVAKVALWLQIAAIILSVVVAIVTKTFHGKELIKYIIETIGTIGGVIYMNLKIEEMFKS